MGFGKGFEELKSEKMLSVVVPTFNAGKYIHETLDSILGQTMNDFEVLVQDNCSGDDTLPKIESFKDARISIESKNDAGYIDAFSKAFERSTGKYIIQCCASDGFIDKNWFKSATDALEANPHISLVWGFPIYMDAEGKLGNLSYSWFRYFIPKPREYLYYWLNFGLHLPEGNFVVRREVIQNYFPLIQNIPFSDLEFDGFFEFMVNFFRHGLLAMNIRVTANYGRQHPNSLTQADTESFRAEHRFALYQSQRSSIVNSLRKYTKFEPTIASLRQEERFSSIFFYYIKVKWSLIHFISRSRPFA